MARTPRIFTLVVLALLAGAPPASAAGTWGWPVRGEVITSYRNGGDPYAGGQHRGIDIAAPVGRAVAASTSGRVTFAGAAGSSGLTVSVRTADGRWDTSYLHLASLAVREGDEVGRGARLGAVGTSGRRSAERPHLHFGVREAGSRHAYRDPMSFLAPPAGPGERRPPAAPAPLPLPLTAAPGAAPAPAARRAPVPAASRMRAPAGAPGRAPAPAPAHSAVAKALSPAALGPAPAPRPRTEAERAHARAPEAGPATQPRAGRAPAPSPAGRVRVPTGSGGGHDLGWALACLGVVAASLALGRPGREGAPRGRFGTAALRVFGGWPTTSRPRSTT